MRPEQISAALSGRHEETCRPCAARLRSTTEPCSSTSHRRRARPTARRHHRPLARTRELKKTLATASGADATHDLAPAASRFAAGGGAELRAEGAAVDTVPAPGWNSTIRRSAARRFNGPQRTRRRAGRRRVAAGVDMPVAAPPSLRSPPPTPRRPSPWPRTETRVADDAHVGGAGGPLLSAAAGGHRWPCDTGTLVAGAVRCLGEGYERAADRARREPRPALPPHGDRPGRRSGTREFVACRPIARGGADARVDGGIAAVAGQLGQVRVHSGLRWMTRAHEEGSGDAEQTVVAHVAWTAGQRLAVTGDSHQPCLCVWHRNENAP